MCVLSEASTASSVDASFDPNWRMRFLLDPLPPYVRRCPLLWPRKRAILLGRCVLAGSFLFVLCVWGCMFFGLGTDRTRMARPTVWGGMGYGGIQIESGAKRCIFPRAIGIGIRPADWFLIKIIGNEMDVSCSMIKIFACSMDRSSSLLPLWVKATAKV